MWHASGEQLSGGRRSFLGTINQLWHHMEIRLHVTSCQVMSTIHKHIVASSMLRNIKSLPSVSLPHLSPSLLFFLSSRGRSQQGEDAVRLPWFQPLYFLCRLSTGMCVWLCAVEGFLSVRREAWFFNQWEYMTEGRREGRDEGREQGGVKGWMWINVSVKRNRSLRWAAKIFIPLPLILLRGWRKEKKDTECEKEENTEDTWMRY